MYCPAGEIRDSWGAADPRCVGCDCTLKGGKKRGSKLVCQECDSTKTKVIETRAEETVIQRIRECLVCEERYLTEEKIVSKKRYI